MTERTVLPNRRRSVTFTFEHGGHSYVATLGYHDDGRLGEVFLSSGRSGTTLGITAADSAICASLALQHGVSVKTLRDAFLRDESGGPAGPLGALFDLLGGPDGLSRNHHPTNRD